MHPNKNPDTSYPVALLELRAPEFFCLEKAIPSYYEDELELGLSERSVRELLYSTTRWQRSAVLDEGLRNRNIPSPIWRAPKEKRKEWDGYGAVYRCNRDRES